MTTVITNQSWFYPCMVIYDLNFDKGREKEKEKKFGDSKPRHFRKKMAEATIGSWR